MVTEEDVHSGVERLRAHGLYARGSCSIDWDNSRRSGRLPTLIRGGSHTEGDDIRVICNAFYIEVSDSPPGYLVRSPSKVGQMTDEVPFDTFDDAIAYVLKNWKAP